MPVKKFRSVEEMPSPPWREPGSPELWKAIEETWAAASRLAPLRFPPGVYRHRSIEELNAQTEEWQRQNVKRLAERPRTLIQPGKPMRSCGLGSDWATGTLPLPSLRPRVETLRQAGIDRETQDRGGEESMEPPSQGMSAEVIPEIPRDWLEEFEAASRRSLKTRFRYAFIKTYRPVLDDAEFRSFDTTADYRRWCEANLPSWLGYGSV